MPEAAPQISNIASDALRHYDRLKLDIAAIGQAAMHQCVKDKNEEGERAFQSVLARLAEDRFNLAVVGPFSRGKSSLMNAILGFGGLPTGLLPHTSVITTVSYGSEELVLIRCEGCSLPEKIRLDQLAEYVTERGNPGNRRRVALAEIQLPIEILRHGLHFIDTPGVGSAIVANTKTTERFLPEIDAAIFVSSFDCAFSATDMAFLRMVSETVGVVFFVLNKLDLASESESKEVVRFVREQLDRELGIGRYALFAVSAKRALDAKLHGDSIAFARSGLLELEDALAAFMDGEKTRQLAVRVMDRLVTLLQREVAHASFSLDAKRVAGQVPEALARFDVKTAALKARGAELVNRLGTLGNDALRAVEPRLDSAFTNLKQSASQKFLPDYLAGRIFSRPNTFEAFARNLRAFCERALARELRVYEAALNERMDRSLGPVRTEMVALPDQLFELGMNDDPYAQGLTKPSADEREAVAPVVEIGGIARVEWIPRLPWWIYVAPLRWHSPAVKRQFDAALGELLAQYRSGVDASIRFAMKEYVEKLGHQIDKAIDTGAVRVKRLLVSGSFDENRKVFEMLLDRTNDLRRQFDARGDSRTRLKDDARGGSAGAGTPHSCPICRAVIRAVFDYLSKLQYELSIDANAQHDHAESGGFCPMHTWIYSSITSPVAISRAYPPLLDALAARLEVAARDAVSIEALSRTLFDLSPSPKSCGACAVALNATLQQVAEVLKSFDSEGRGEAPALCVPHLTIALQLGPDLKRGRMLGTQCAHALLRDADDMRHHALKHDAIRRGLMTKDERDAHVTGIRRLVGERLLALPPRDDDRL
jgi:GTP-binding protein EngB required for normal cell division